MTDNVLYRVDVDIRQVQAKLGVVDKEFKKLEGNAGRSTSAIGKNGAQHIQQLSDVFQLLGVRGSFAIGRLVSGLGVLGVAAGGLVVTINVVRAALEKMVQLAVTGFTAATTASIETGKEFDALKAQLTAVFEGSPEAAEAAFSRIRQISRDFGFDATSLARTFIPEVESLDQLEEIVKLGTALARFQPEQGATGARIALQGALEGTDQGLLSLQRRFEIPKSSIDRIRELQDELGAVDGLIVGLSAELDRTGRSLEDLGGTLDVQLGKAAEFFRDIQGVAGEPIVDALIDEFETLNDLLNENEDEISIIANAFGEAIGRIVRLLGDLAEKFLEGFDEEKALELADAISELGLGIEAIIKLLAGGLDTSGFELVLDVVNRINESVNGLVITLAQLKPTVAFLADLNRQIKENRADTNIADKILLPGLSGAIDTFDVDFGQAQEAYNQATIESIGLLTELALETRKVTGLNEDYADSLNAVGDAGNAAADGILAGRKSAEDLAALESEAADARQTIAEKNEEFLIDKERARMDLLKKQKRAEIDLEIELSEKRQDVERKNREKIEDIYRKHANGVRDAATDLQRKRADIELEFARKQQDIDLESADKRIQIEEDFRRELEEIRRKFEFDAEEAIRANDALAFLRIQRRAEFEIQEAKDKKKEETATVTEEAKKQTEELALLRQREIEDAQIANQRQLEDLRRRLQDELTAQQVAYQRELQELAIYEERKRAELRRNAQRELEDFNTTWQRRLEDLQRNLQKELEILRRFEAEKARILAQSRARLSDAAGADRVLLQNYGNNRARANPVIDTPRNRLEASGADTVLTQNYGGRRFGGPVFPGRRYLVGEDEPEIFSPGTTGTIFPLRKTLNSLLYSPRLQGATGSIINKRNTNIDLSMLDPTRLSPQHISMIRTIVLQILADVS